MLIFVLAKPAMNEDSQLIFTIPQNQSTVRDHIFWAKWDVRFPLTSGDSDPPRGYELNTGKLRSPGGVEIDLRQIRSIDMLKNISEERFDLAIVGSDCFEERGHPHLRELARFPYGRKWDAPQPRLEVCAHPNSTINHLNEVEPGAIFMTERPHLTQIKLRERDLAAVFEGNHADPLEVKKTLVEQQMVGIREIAGSGPAQLDSRPEYVDKYFVVMVNETGSTVRDYDLKVVDKLCDIDIVLISPEKSLMDREKGSILRQFAQDMEEAYIPIRKEFESRRGGSIERL